MEHEILKYRTAVLTTRALERSGYGLLLLLIELLLLLLLALPFWSMLACTFFHVPPG